MKPIPQEAIDSLPDGYVLLGWGGEFDVEKRFHGTVYDFTSSRGWTDPKLPRLRYGSCIGSEGEFLYAAPDESQIVELNRKAGKLPTFHPSEISLPTEHSNKTMKTIYIAGPMRGKQFFNFPAFDAARDKLVDEGWEVISPADIDRKHGFDALELPVVTNWNDLSEVDVTREECFDRDMAAIRHDCSAIYMLKGWQTSTGAQAEYWAARWLDLDIYYEEESICEEAFRIQGGDRQQDYGDPTENFEEIANLWREYVIAAGGWRVNFTARDVAHMMILMKVARNCHKAKRDNWVDIAGYAQCGGKIDKV